MAAIKNVLSLLPSDTKITGKIGNGCWYYPFESTAGNVREDISKAYESLRDMVRASQSFDGKDPRCVLYEETKAYLPGVTFDLAVHSQMKDGIWCDGDPRNDEWYIEAIEITYVFRADCYQGSDPLDVIFEMKKMIELLETLRTE